MLASPNYPNIAAIYGLLEEQPAKAGLHDSRAGLHDFGAGLSIPYSACPLRCR